MEKQSEEIPLLVAQTGPLNGKRWQIRGRSILGRDLSCDIIITDRQVSRQHARLTLTPRGVLLEDLGSKNGTHYNGKRISDPVLLQDGDKVQIALIQHFTFFSSDSTLPLSEEETDYQSFDTNLLRLEKRSRRVWIGEQEVLPPLSVSQFTLLEILYDNQGRVVPRRKLIESVWGEEEAIEVSEQALDALVRRLRDRLASVEPEHNFIVTIRGHGLRLENPQINIWNK